MCQNLKYGKADGADRLVAEHIVHAAPSLIIHLKLLFSLFYRTVMYLLLLVLQLLFLLSRISLATLVYLIIIGQLL